MIREFWELMKASGATKFLGYMVTLLVMLLPIRFTGLDDKK